MPMHPHTSEPADPPGATVPVIARFVATVAYCGSVPWASGTVGSAAGLLIYLIPGVASPPVLSALITVMFFVGRWAADRVALAEGNTLQRPHSAG